MSNTLTYHTGFQKRHSMLTSLSKYDYTTLSIPYPSEDIRPVFSIISNAETGRKISSDKILEVQLKLMQKLYAAKFQLKPVGESSAWKTISNQLQWLKKECQITNYFEDSTMREVSKQLQAIYKSINTDEKIAVSSVPHDFTPWKLNSDENRLYRFGWETEDCGIPMLTDLFHYFFLTRIIVASGDYKQVSKSIHAALEHPASKKIIKKYTINVQLHYRLYLLFSISHYLRMYISQNLPLSQMHRLSQVWSEALSEIE